MSGLHFVGPQKPVEKCRDKENHIHMSELGQAGRQADRRGGQETQYVSQSTYTQTRRDLGAPLTCTITQTGSGKGKICAYICGYLTYSTNTPPPPQPPFAAEMEACSMTPVITFTQCLPESFVSLFSGSSWPTWKPWSPWTFWSEGTTLINQ